MPNIENTFAVTEAMRKLTQSKSIEPTDNSQAGIFASTPKQHHNLKTLGIAGSLLDTVDVSGKTWIIWELASDTSEEKIMQLAAETQRRSSVGRYLAVTQSSVTVTDSEDNNRLVARAMQRGQHEKIFVLDDNDTEQEFVVHDGQMLVRVGRPDEKLVKCREVIVNSKPVQAKSLRRLTLKAYKAYIGEEEAQEEDSE